MATEVKTYNNQLVEPGYIVDEVKKIDEDIIMGLDFNGNNIIKFVNLVDTYEIENKDKAIFERTKSFTDYTIHGFSNYKVEYRANRVTFNGLESNPNNITLTRMGEEIV